MKRGKMIRIICVLLMFTPIFIESCKKDAGLAISPNNDTAKITRKSAPVVYAGGNKVLFPPEETILLKASVLFEGNKSLIYGWKKLTGPTAVSFENSDALETMVRGLRLGEYSFEITVTDFIGLKGRDTVNVSVIGENEKIFTDRVWIFPWYASLELKNFYNSIPSGIPFKVFVQRDNVPGWIEATLASNNPNNSVYEYFVESRPDGAGIYTYGSLYIFYYGFDTNDTPDIKIQF